MSVGRTDCTDRQGTHPLLRKLKDTLLARAVVADLRDEQERRSRRCASVDPGIGRRRVGRITASRDDRTLRYALRIFSGELVENIQVVLAHHADADHRHRGAVYVYVYGGAFFFCNMAVGLQGGSIVKGGGDDVIR